MALVVGFVACGGDSSTSSAGSPTGANDDDSSSSVVSSSSSVIPSDVDIESSGSSIPYEFLSSPEEGSSGSSSARDVGGSSSSVVSAGICEEGDVDSSQLSFMVSYLVCRNGWWEIDHYIVLSSSSTPPSSDSHYDMTYQFRTDEFTYEDFVDPRDSQVYKTVVLKPGYLEETRFFAENLNYGKQVLASETNFSDSITEKLCYDDDPWYCENGFGGLYTWSEAMGLPRACDTLFLDSSAACMDNFVLPEGTVDKWGFEIQRQGICPEGWHIMNTHEWLGFRDYSQGALLSRAVWSYSGENNHAGLSILPSGWYLDVKYDYIEKSGNFWSVSGEFDYNAGYFVWVSDNYWVKKPEVMDKRSHISVRCAENK